MDSGTSQPLKKQTVTLTSKFKLVPTEQQLALLNSTAEEYISLVNDIADYFSRQMEPLKLTSKDVNAALPSVLKCQAIREACELNAKYCQTGTLPILKKRKCAWNNQNFKLVKDGVQFPVLIDGSCKRISVKALFQPGILPQLQSSELGSLRIWKRGEKWLGSVGYEVVCTPPAGSNIMGIDLGIKCPAVCAVSNGDIRFFGDGQARQHIREYYQARLKSMRKAGTLKEMKKSCGKENRIMVDFDHKLSREIIDFAMANDVSVIRMEDLSGLQNYTKVFRKKNKRAINTWSRFRLMQFISYKAEMAGIRVELVSPAYTSQTCPKCGKRHHANDRKFVCSCGYSQHRDAVAAINIMRKSP